MATNKYATIRYQALDKCFANSGRKYFIDDLVDACNNAIFEFSGSAEGVKKRQVQDDINFMESESGYAIELDRIRENRKVYYRYSDPNFSINKQPLNATEEAQLREALLTLSRFKGMPQFIWVEELTVKLESELGLKKIEKKVIEFEQNPYLKGLDYISVLYNSILYKNTLEVEYKSFKAEEPTQAIFSPHYLKQYNNRWFVFGYQGDYTTMTTLALDRILQIESISDSYKESTIDYEEHFEDVVGVTIPIDEELETIRLKVDASIFPYISSKPLHGSQKIKEVTDTHSVIELQLIPNYELETVLLSFADKISILEPILLKIKVLGRLKKALDNY
jgi:predicted DNA-binding transcriptional regulator YafY